MAPITTASNDETHAALLDTLDVQKLPKPFRNPTWKPPQRRNKNLKQILSEAHRAQQSLFNTQQNSGASTPAVAGPPSSSSTTKPPQNQQSLNPNPALASQDLSRAVLSKNLASTAAQTPAPAAGGPPQVSYTSLAAAPSLRPKKKYCDITGLPAKYRDPKTGLYYADREVYGVVRGLTTGQVQEFLGLRGAGTVLK